jgi:predicted ATPase/DNA-binding winged helix-turn-helix (wHTH) protein
MRTERTIYEFDDFRVDTGQFFLVKAGQTIPITPTVFRILLVLLERPGEMVTKEDMMKSVWPDCFVEPGNLNRNVSTLRKALDEKPSDHRYIETIPKTGYRFVAPVRSMTYQPANGGVRKPVTPDVHQIVGRNYERAALRRVYDRAQQGHGGVVCVSGDAGLGKTALVDVFIDDLARDGQTLHIARGRCSESFTESEPFMPWIEALGELAGEAAISGVMQKTAPSWHREISHTGSGSSRKMRRELLDFCKQMASSHPLMIVIDDFHWADIGSVDLLSFLATRLESTRTVVIVCYRPVEIKIKNHPFLRVRSELLGREGCTEIMVPFLSRENIEEHLEARSADRKFPDDYAAVLYAKTEGNPLFLREMIRGTAEVSDSVKNMIRAKLDQLDDTHRQLLVTASVQGREFDSAVLAASMQMSPQDVEESLHDLDELYGLVRRIREEQLPDGKFTVRYRFVYALCQETCYASLAPTRRASLNASLAEAFLTYYGN